MQPVKQRKANEKGFRAGAPIDVRRCARCDTELADPKTVHCPTCAAEGHHELLLHHDTISLEKTEEIMNRYVDRTAEDVPVASKPLEDLWDQGRIPSHVRATVRPVGGKGTKLEFVGRKNKDMWIDKVIELNGSYYTLSSIAKAIQHVM